jgi:hypothetical protein
MKTKIIIEIETEFKPFILTEGFDAEPEDYRLDVESTFHDKIVELTEEFMIDEEKELQNNVLDAINEEYLSNNDRDEELKNWNQLGKVDIRIMEVKTDENIEVKK